MAQVIKRRDTYTIRVSAGFDSTGKRIKKNFTWAPDSNMTPTQIKKALSQQIILFEKKVSSGSVIDSKMKFSDFASLWIKNHAEKQLAPKTIFEYKRLLIRINEAIGHIQLDKLRPYHLMDFYDTLSKEGIRSEKRFVSTPGLKERIKKVSQNQANFARLCGVHENTIHNACSGNTVSERSAVTIASALRATLSDCFIQVDSNQSLSSNTINHYHRLISTILNKAVIWEAIESNPSQRVDAPKIKTPESQYMNEEESQRVITLLENEPIQFRTMITLLIYSGLRRGELGGLQWKDVDFNQNVIHIRRVTQYLPGQSVFIKETKNKGSTRTIKISSVAFVLLKQFKLWQDEERLRLGKAWQNDYREQAKVNNTPYQSIDWVFTTWNGMPIFPDTITIQFKNFTKRNNLPYVGIHGLRHTNATLQIASGINLRTVSSRLGHSQTSTTSNIYAHALQSADAAAAEALENILNPPQKHGVDTKWTQNDLLA